MQRRKLALPILFLPLLTFSCGEPVDVPPVVRPVPPVLTVLAGGTLTDTILTPAKEGLIVQVLGPAGLAEPRVRVEFWAPELSWNACPIDYTQRCSRIQVATVPDGGFWTSSAAVETDTLGRARVRLRLGTSAGEGTITIKVPLYGLEDTLRYTVQPGAAANLVVGPRDTLLAVGSGFTARATVTDRASNPLPDPVTWDGGGQAVQVTAAGQVSARAFGQAYVRARAQIAGRARFDSVGVSVAPAARFAEVSGSNFEMGGALVLSDLTGANARTLVPGRALAPDWSPTGDLLVYAEAGGERLVIVDTLGAMRPLPTPGIGRTMWPKWSADRQWIYFEGVPDSLLRIYRVHPDGTGLEALLSTPGAQAGAPAPSPDGRRVAYVKDALMVRTLGTSHVDTLAVGQLVLPRWSPDGQWIAYIDQGVGLGLIHPDGSARHVVRGMVAGCITWSPDSRWLVVSGYDTLALVDAVAGAYYRLGVPGYYIAWRP